MKRFIKKWWFSISMWLFAITILVYVIIATNLFDEDLLFYTLILLSCVTPVMLMTVIGFAAMPEKENKNEKEN